MRKGSLFLCLVLFALPLAAQVRTGNIYGQAVDQEGNSLPGVTITLTGQNTAPMTTITTAEGIFRFLSLFPARDYTLKAELQGFKTKTETGIIVNVGVNTESKMTMELGALTEEVTVTAVTPVVDAKKTTIAKTVDYEILQSIPTARDPWVVLQMAPSIMVDRENIGGNESGQMPYFVSKGSSTDSQWTMDGVVITDPSSNGSSGYFDFDMFEEMQITTGAADVDTPNGTVAINMVTRRGGNKTTIGGRIYLTDEAFQAKLDPARIQELKIAGYNKIVRMQDMGFNVGGPLWKDKIWWWGSYGVQDIKSTVITGTRDDTNLENLTGKLNFQLLSNNRAEVMINASGKRKFGRSASPSYPDGWNQRPVYHFGMPIFKVQDEHTFGDSLFLSLKYGFTGGGFGLYPKNDDTVTKMYWYDLGNDLSLYSQTWFTSFRPQDFYSAQLVYFNDNLFGMAHEVKVGFDYSDRRNRSVSGYPGNMYVEFNIDEPTVDWDGNGTRDLVKDLPNGFDIRRFHVYRNTETSSGSHDYSAYLRDTISMGRFNIMLGLRFDSANPYAGAAIGSTRINKTSTEEYFKNYPSIVANATTAGTADKILALMPDKTAPAVNPSFAANTWSPRLGITWDATGDGKTVAKLSASLYNNYLGFSGSWFRQGGAAGEMMFYWADANNDSKIDWRELYWANYGSSARAAYRAWDDAGNFQGNWAREFGLNWEGWSYTNPAGLDPCYYVIDPNMAPSKTYEVLGSLERELMPDFQVAVDLSYRRYTNFGRSSSYYPDTGHIRGKDDYIVAGQIPATFTDPKTGIAYSAKDAAGKSWYALKAGADYGTTNYTYRSNWGSGYYQVFYGFDFRFNKRLTNRWMLDGSFSLQWQQQYYGNDYENPNNIWAIEGKTYMASMGGGSGKISQLVWSRWLAKLEGLYQFPLDFNFSFTFTAREGYTIPERFTVYDYRLPNTRSQSSEVYALANEDCSKLPTYLGLTLRLEKMVKIATSGKIYLMIDVFNPLNLDTLNRKYNFNYGNWYLHNNTWSSNSSSVRSGQANEVVNPRVFRFGIRFNI